VSQSVNQCHPDNSLITVLFQTLHSCSRCAEDCAPFRIAGNQAATEECQELCACKSHIDITFRSAELFHLKHPYKLNIKDVLQSIDHLARSGHLKRKTSEK